MKQVLAPAAEGARAIHVPTFPAEVGLPEYHDACYDPVWAAIQETGMSISQHLGRSSPCGICFAAIRPHKRASSRRNRYSAWRKPSGSGFSPVCWPGFPS